MASIDKLDKINIYASAFLSIDDYASLTLLYTPVVGVRAINVYQTLYAILDRKKLSIDNLTYINILDLLGIDDDTFYDARLKLEATGLMETLNKGDLYVFMLKQPLTPKQFLMDSIFSVYLKDSVGDEMFEYIVNTFKIAQIDRLGYKNISASFDQVFETKEYDSKFNIDGFIMGKKPNGSVIIKNHTFDFESFLLKIDNKLISNMTDARKTITNISYIYGYDSDIMVLLFNQSISTNGYFDSKILKRKAELYNKHLNDGKLKAVEKPLMSEEEFQLMNLVANSSVKEMLDSLWPDYPKTYLKNISDIYEGIDILERDVLNILLFHVLKIKSGILPNITYIRKVAETWKNDGLDTRESAWKYVRGLMDVSKEPLKKEYVKEKHVDTKKAEFTDDYDKSFDERIKKL